MVVVGEQLSLRDVAGDEEKDRINCEHESGEEQETA